MSTVLSLLFLIAFFTYLFWGIKIIKLYPESKLNKLFLLLCISLGIWSLGFSRAIVAINIKKSISWYRFAAFGWSWVFSIYLHFTLILTGRRKYASRKSLVGLIYMPAFITIIIFSLSNITANKQYKLVNTVFGWTNVLNENLFYLFFHSYYIAFGIISLMLMNKWKKRLDSKKSKRQASFMMLGMLVAFVLSAFTDIILKLNGVRYFPQLGPLFMLVPAWTIYYSEKHYGIIKSNLKEEEEIIVTEKEQEKIFNNLAAAYCIGGFVAFVAEFMSNNCCIKLAFIKGAFMISVGISMFMVQRIQNDFVRELLTIILLLLSILVIALQFLDHANATVWALPIIIMMSSLLFTKKNLLISATIVAIITQRLVWILRPESIISVGRYDYITRIGMYITACFMGIYINKIYVSKIKENKYQFDFQKMNSDISMEFINLNMENLKEKTYTMIERMGEFFDIDRIHLFIVDYSSDRLVFLNKWCKKYENKDKLPVKDLMIEEISCLLKELEEKKIVHIGKKSKLRCTIDSPSEYLTVTPIIGEGKIQGLICMECMSEAKKWTNKKIELLTIMANLLASGLLQIRSDNEIEYMAYYDELTGIPNRFYFEKEVIGAIKQANKKSGHIGIMFVDLDNFKSINDTMGHSSGDYILKEIARTFANNLREGDLVARFAGDEFIFLFNNIRNYKEISKLAQSTMDAFVTPFKIKNQEIFIRGSAGISIYPQDGICAETLIKNADTAMYEAKSLGKNQFLICTEEIKDKVQKNMRLSNDLYRALEKNELIVYYQPQINLKTGKISGFEALVRWLHPQFGMISPSVFIPLAEKNNLINSIGDWVLETACAQNKEWQELGYGKMTMGVNLSAVQLINPNLEKKVEEILKKTDLDPKYLEIEITESIAIRSTDSAINILNKLRKLGVSIAIDDFGTEYSSLSRLRSLPVDKLKIDMQFIQGIDEDKKERSITSAIINLAKSLELKVLSEGVETKEQLDFLKEEMCDYVQGYYYYKPMPGDKVKDIIKYNQNPSTS